MQFKGCHSNSIFSGLKMFFKHADLFHDNVLMPSTDSKLRVHLQLMDLPAATGQAWT
jgi:hypothetical protein